MRKPVLILTVLLFFSCRQEKKAVAVDQKELPERFIVVLGIAQDAGYPQIGCEKECCKAYWEDREEKKHVTCLALVDRKAEQYWLFEATPDIAEQLHRLQAYLPDSNAYTPAGIFLTHAHTGHYAGLMELGREAMGAKGIPVMVMPRMDSFLRNNGPWSQLVSLHNISLQRMAADSALSLMPGISITPFRVPHRDEYSETAGFRIRSGEKTILFIPDIDKWEKWDRDIVAELKGADRALLDGTFYRNGELTGRDMREVPHPFVEESMQKFRGLPDAERAKILYIHFNHTNPLLRKESPEKKSVQAAGYGVAEEGMIIPL